MANEQEITNPENIDTASVERDALGYQAGSAEHWNDKGFARKAAESVTSLVAAVAGHPERQDQLDADRHASFMQGLQRDVAAVNADEAARTRVNQE